MSVGPVSVDRQLLERRYRRLLRWYSPTYRASRGSEILDTLMEAAVPGQRRPAGFERRALVVGGLRARTGADQQRTRAAVWLGGLRLGIMLLLVHAAAGAAVNCAEMTSELASGKLFLVNGVWEVAYGRGRLSMAGQWGHPLTLLLVAAGLVLLAAGRPAPSLALTLAAVAAQQWADSWMWAGSWMPPWPWGEFMFHQPVTQLPLAAALLVPLLWRRPPTTPRPWRWLLTIPAGVVVLPTTFDVSFPSDQLFVLLLVAALAWCVIDARVPVALSAVLLGYTIPTLLGSIQQIMPITALELATLSLLLLATALRANRQCMG
jgi:hypothetical protein